MTVYKWRKRKDVQDRSHLRHNLHQSTSPAEEEIIVELYENLGISIKDIREVMHRCINDTLSLSAIQRCLKRRGAVKGPPQPMTDKPSSQTFDQQPFGYVHIDLKHL